MGLVKVPARAADSNTPLLLCLGTPAKFTSAIPSYDAVGLCRTRPLSYCQRQQHSAARISRYPFWIIAEHCAPRQPPLCQGRTCLSQGSTCLSQGCTHSPKDIYLLSQGYIPIIPRICTCYPKSRPHQYFPPQNLLVPRSRSNHQSLQFCRGTCTDPKQLPAPEIARPVKRYQLKKIPRTVARFGRHRCAKSPFAIHHPPFHKFPRQQGCFFHPSLLVMKEKYKVSYEDV